MKIEEYLTWKKEKDSFLKMLESSASVLLSRMDEIFKVLDKIIELKERKLPIEEYQLRGRKLNQIRTSLLM